ncbi:hypothetical protein CHH57_02200 [Niallia circulans]|uniref:Uncharacterized protein n=1 Tax=Niallia circulans TaxID=1397 RepID=A0AA91Z2F8_NIACI|nr:hypothetical protein [Niallia circulans]PAD84863.1 hypothetical protein CHH57_02200 [Niallia circulans]
MLIISNGTNLYILEMFNRKQLKLEEERKKLYKALDNNTEELMGLAKAWKFAESLLMASKK